jgi:ubiquitin-like protein Pup
VVLVAQESKNKATASKKSEEEEVAPAELRDEQNEKLSADVDDLLDEIDSVLEADAETFVSQYIQRVDSRGAKRGARELVLA